MMPSANLVTIKHPNMLMFQYDYQSHDVFNYNHFMCIFFCLSHTYANIHIRIDLRQLKQNENVSKVNVTLPNTPKSSDTGRGEEVRNCQCDMLWRYRNLIMCN